ncbi:MAG TPA: hypothetical protein VE174_06930 [Actinomycetota bacterium]|nr:hypothetical protein [Actinomycetota bacterium]
MGAKKEMSSNKKRWPISFALLDFLAALSVIAVISAVVSLNPRPLITLLAFGVILGLAKFFDVMPEGYFTHLFRGSRSPKI